MGITIEHNLDPEVKEDAEDVKRTIKEKNRDVHNLNAVIDGGSSNLTLTIISGRINGNVIKELENQGRSCEIMFESREILINTKI